MKDSELKDICLKEEKAAFSGWDFSRLSGRWEEESLPWDYKSIVNKYRKDTSKLLDIGTGGGEFLLSLNHPYNLTSASEAYKPNIELCMKKLKPLGIDIRAAEDDDILPFENDSFDIVINRHESFDAKEIRRVLRMGSYFVTQQVGAKNNCDLASLIIDNYESKFPDQTLVFNEKALKNADMKPIYTTEFFPTLKFFDIGAFVYFAKIIEWEFPGFSVEKHFEKLKMLQATIEEKGYIQSTEHRYLIVAKKTL